MGGEKRYEYTTNLSPPVTVTERDDPLTVIVKVPLYQAGVVAVAVAVILILVSVLIASRLYPLPWEVVLIIPVIVGMVAGVGMFLAISWRRLLPIFEERYRVDINGDGVIGEPPQTERHEYRLTWDTGGAWFELPDGVALDRFVIVCKKLLIGRTAEDDHRGMTDELVRVRDMFFAHGLGAWRNERAKNQGWILTAPGRAFCRRVVGDDRPPLP